MKKNDFSGNSPLNELHRHARQGWLWNGIDLIVQKGLTMIVSLLLARLLDPAAFGLIASVSIFLTVAGQIIDGGIAQRIVQKSELGDEDYCTLFWCNGVMSLICCGVLVITAGLIAHFLGNSQLRLIVIALAGNIFLLNAGRVQETYLMRNLRFRTASVIRIASVVAGCVAGLILAFKGFGVWSLIGQQAVSGAIKATVLWGIVPWKPSAKISCESIRDLYSFGLPIVFSESARNIASQSINILIAKSVSMTALGLYDRGRIIPQSIVFLITNLFGRSNFPVLARLQHDNQGFQETYLHFFKISTASLFLLMTGLGVCAADVVQIVLGEKWLSSVWFLQAYCVTGSVSIIFIANAQVLRSKGLSRSFFRYNMLLAGLQLIGVVSGLPWGAKGMVIGDMAAWFLICFPSMHATSKLSRIRIENQLRALVRPLYMSLLLGVTLLVVRMFGLSLWPRFITSGLVGIIFFYLYWFYQRKKVCCPN